VLCNTEYSRTKYQVKCFWTNAALVLFKSLGLVKFLLLKGCMYLITYTVTNSNIVKFNYNLK